MTKRARIYVFITRQRNMLGKTTISVMTGMTETTVPCIMSCGGGSESTGRRTLESVKLPRTVTPKKFTPSKKVLHRETKRVKIDRTVIISSKLTNRDKIFNNARCNENIAKMKRTIRKKRRKRGMSRRRDGDRGAVSNGDMAVNGMWREREERIPASLTR
jgi:hypothetical protein